jgi:hypothetical protein
MRKFILLTLLLSVAAFGCKKDPVVSQKTNSTSVYEGTYTDTANTPQDTGQKATVTITDNGTGTYGVNIAKGGAEANLTAGTKSGSTLLIFTTQPLFNLSVIGSGEYQNNGQDLFLSFTAAGQVNATAITFRGTKQ